MFKDDRTEEQKRTHSVLVVGTDPFMSRLGLGTSVAAWACEPADLLSCLAWVENRGDLLRLRIIHDEKRWRPKADHVHVYLWRPSPPQCIACGDRWPCRNAGGVHMSVDECRARANAANGGAR